MRLRVLDDVTWDGSPVPGARTRALLRALAEAGPRGGGEQWLVEAIWGDDLPANPAKALQVVVSRARSATDAGVIERTPGGYRIALEAEDIDAWGVRPVGLRLAAEGHSAEALPLLERAPTDEDVVEALLRSTSAVHGVPAALERYEAYRADLAARLGVDPSPALRELHQELLASDRPVRSGVQHYASSLIGRDADLTALRRLLREQRVVSIVGPGGLGKTRLAQLVASGAEQPTVHVVELVGVADPDDLVGEVGSVLGVRDSVSGRRALTREQRRDVRARIAQHLDRAPTLLVLDNCEHLVDAVADLVAYLVTAVPRLRILTTTRTPLAIAAEHVFPLQTLEPEPAAELFRQRAVAARPGVALPADLVASIVERLDGLPLAIELAAVKVRAMSVADVDARLENRFALLRGGDRSAPDRHQTLLAVIDWSWNLLGAGEQRALRRLSVFHDGFTMEAAGALLGLEALDAVEGLVSNSLLTLIEHDGGVRYRMLETVREFGRMQLVDAGEDVEAVHAQRRWAVEFCRGVGVGLFSPDQVDAAERMRAEDGNLTDVLRRALADGDAGAVVSIYAALGGYWTIVGDHPRAFSISSALITVLDDWDPPADLLEPTRVALASCLLGATLTSSGGRPVLERLAERIGTDSASPELRATLRVLLGMNVDSRSADTISGLEHMVDDPDPRVRATAFLFLSHARENAGDPRGAIEAADAALGAADDKHGPWIIGMLHAQLCGLYSQMGDMEGAVRHARQALPVMRSLGAEDDVVQTMAVLAMGALEDGRVDEAAEIVAQIEDIGVQGPFGAAWAVLSIRGELALARGQIEEARRLFGHAVEVMREVRFPGQLGRSDLAPWVIQAEATALTLAARHDADGGELYAVLVEKAGATLDAGGPMLDLPVCAMLLFSVALWRLLAGVGEARDAVRLLVLADRLAYKRTASAMRWERAVEDIERIAPGLLDAVEQEYAGRRGADLLDDARALVARLW